MEFLSTDLHFEILLRLPATTLATTARQVCRLWRSIISQPTFVHSHFKRSVDDDDNTHLLFYSNWWRPNGGLLMYSSARDLTLLLPKNRIFPEAAMCNPLVLVCNGLVLYICRKQKILQFFLYNPILDQNVSLPPIKPPKFCCSCCLRSGRMEPRKVRCKCGVASYSERYQSWGFGFGFDQITKEYKVVVISKSTRVYCCTVDVVPEKKKTISPWKISDPLNHLVRLKSINGVFVNGRLHWLYSNNTHPYRSSNTDDRILSVDLHTDELTLFSCPSDNWHQSKRLGVLGGTKLCVYVSNHYYGNGTRVVESSVCVMEDYGNVNSWTEYRRFKNLSFDYGNFYYWKSGLFVFHHHMNRYFVVDDETNEILDYIDHTKTQRDHSFVSTFVPSLVSLLSDVNLQDQKEEEEGV